MGPPLNRRDWPRLGLLAFAVLVASLWIYGLHQPRRWEAPPQYSVDALETLARFKLSSEQPWAPWFGQRFERLGAPFGADWSSYPLPDQWLYWLIGQLSRVTGLVAASYFALMAAHLLAAVSFYLCARQLGHRPFVGAICALLFAFSHFNLHRSLSHYSFTLSFGVPLLLLLAWWLGGSQRLRITRATMAVIVLVSAIGGAANPYFTFLFLQLLGGALLYQLTGERRTANLRALVCAIGVTSFVFVVGYAPTLIDRWTAGGNDPASLIRNYAGSEVYALKPVELAIPPASHRISWFSSVGNLYRNSTQAPGEFPGAYLGLVGVAALSWMVLDALWRWRAGRGALRPAGPVLVLWIGVVAVVGGGHGALALAGVDEFRAGNRYSIVILSIALLFLSHRLSRLWPISPRARAAAIVVGSLLGMIGLYDQLPRRRSSDDADRLAKEVADDRQFARALEASLPRSALVFQLPAMPFPEQGTIGTMTDYALFRPYLHSESLRFSYGSVVGTKEARWASWVSRLPPDELLQTLESAGFGALYLNRSAFPDRGASLINALIERKRSLVPWPETSDHAAIRLRPRPVVRRPDLDDPRLLDRWSGAVAAPPERAALYVAQGWYPLESAEGRSWRWAQRSATVVVWNPAPARPTRISFTATTASAGTLELWLNGRSVWKNTGRGGVSVKAEVPITIDAGATRLEWRFDGRVRRPAGTDRRRLGFLVQDPRVSYTE